MKRKKLPIQIYAICEDINMNGVACRAIGMKMFMGTKYHFAVAHLLEDSAEKAESVWGEAYQTCLKALTL